MKLCKYKNFKEYLLCNIWFSSIFKLGASAASEFCEWVQVGIDVYIPHRKYQVKPHSSLWFSNNFAVAIVHRNHFFHLYQNNKSSNSKIKFRQASNHCKKVLEVHYFPETYGCQDFWQISVLNKGKSATASMFNSL